MAVDKLVDSTQLDADLTSVANAIRTKGGTSASLAFPAGFVDAIDAIETGGGGAANGYHVYTGITPNADSGNITIPIDETPIFTFINFPDVTAQEEAAEPYPIKSHLWIYNNTAFDEKYAGIRYNFKNVMGVYVGASDSYYSSGVTGSYSSGNVTVGSTRTAFFPANQPYTLLVSY